MTVVVIHLMKKINFIKIEIGLNCFFLFQKEKDFLYAD